MTSTTSPLIPRSQILAGVAGTLNDHLACAREYGLGIEIQYLAMPPWLGQDWRDEAQKVKELLQDLEGPIGLHGHFMDTCHISPDPEIRTFSAKRYRESMDMAEAIGARFVVFHTQYNTMLRLPHYPSAFHDASMEFWPRIGDEAVERGLTIYVENMFDVDPEPSARMAHELDHPAIQLCFDVAHAEIHSDIPVNDWIAAYGDKLGHVHINDCDGKNDLHLDLGEGTLDLGAAIDSLNATGRPLTYTLETRASGRVSAEYLGLKPLG